MTFETDNSNTIGAAKHDLQGMDSAVFSALQVARNALLSVPARTVLIAQALAEIDALFEPPADVCFSRPRGVPNSPKKVDSDIKINITDEMFNDGVTVALNEGFRSPGEWLREVFCDRVYKMGWHDLQQKWREEDKARRIAENRGLNRPLMALRSSNSNLQDAWSISGESEASL